MSERLIVRPEAEQDISEAIAWYEARKERLGVEFVTAVENALSAIQSDPLSFAVVHKRVRRALLRRFPKRASKGWKSRVT